MPAEVLRRNRRAVAAALATAVAAALLPVGASAARPRPAIAAVVRTDLPPLPDGVAPAARRPEPSLPQPAAWPFTERFPRTHGTGRLDAGALLWTDFLYDDNGAVSGPSLGESAGAYTFGTYEYPDPDHRGNAADVFRVGIGATRAATWWRVDWNTLVDPAAPAAAFAVDLDGGGGPSVAWGGNTGLSSAGVDHTLVVTAAGAFLDGERVADTVVDRAARSFVVRLPRRLLDPSGRAMVWLAAGLADDDAAAFRTLGPEHRHLPGQPNVYNVAFRDYDDEPATNNFWFEQQQALTLTAGGDVTEFGVAVEWGRLVARDRQPEPAPKGWSNRWYVSSVALGQGRVTDPASNVDREPNYLGRVQPYGVYVPTGYDPTDPAPLTWLLHSLTINHNQYSATAPSLIEMACEERGSICATTLGRGPDGFYRDVAELDFWEVWRALGRTYALDPERTIIGGYSMGGFGTFNLALDHPDLFAGMFVLASAANEDLPRLENARWTPYYHAHGVFDELVPYLEEARPTIDELDRLGYRYTFDTYPTKDHVGWSLEDGFELAGEWIAAADRRRRRDPGRITYRWFPAEVDHRLGIGATGAWWLRGLRARDPSAAEARVDAVSRGRPVRRVAAQRSRTPFVDPSGDPVLRERLTWERGPAPRRARRMGLSLTNVGRATVDLSRAGLRAAPGTCIVVATDGATVLRLRDVGSGTQVLLDGKPKRGTTVLVPKGRHVVTFRRNS